MLSWALQELLHKLKELEERQNIILILLICFLVLKGEVY